MLPRARTDIIRHGPAKMTEGRRGCGFCHLPNGLGRPENAPVAALPPAYFIRQMHDFRDGLRRSADPRKPNTDTMIDLARAMTEEEIAEAARYFAAISWSPRVKVIETDLVPKTRIVGNLFLATEESRTEPAKGAPPLDIPAEPLAGCQYLLPRFARLGPLCGRAQRVQNSRNEPHSGPINGSIIEVPADEENAERLRDPREDMTAIAAYVASKFPPDPVETDAASQ